MKAMRNWMTGAGMTLALAGGMVATTAQAALVDRGGGMIYDTVLDITWLADANYARTQYIDSGGTLGDAYGRMTWAAASTWAANLVYGGFSDWRLPTVSSVGSTFNSGFSTNATTDLGYAKTTTDGTDGGWRNASGAPVSELGHMFYVNLANKGFCTPNDANPGPGSCVPQSGFGLSDDPANPNDESLFLNLQSDVYWFGTVYAPDPASFAWLFDINDGQQGYNCQGCGFYAWAVRPGDVLAVTEPASALLIALGLAGLGAVRRRRLGA